LIVFDLGNVIGSSSVPFISASISCLTGETPEQKSKVYKDALSAIMAGSSKKDKASLTKKFNMQASAFVRLLVCCIHFSHPTLSSLQLSDLISNICSGQLHFVRPISLLPLPVFVFHILFLFL
jgi:hypothetical protein